MTALRISWLGVALLVLLVLLLPLVPSERAAAQHPPQSAVPPTPAAPNAATPNAATPNAATPNAATPPIAVPAAPVEPLATPSADLESESDQQEPESVASDQQEPGSAVGEQGAEESTPAPVAAQPAMAKLIYVLERVDIVGNSMDADVIKRFVPFQPGDPLDVEDPEIERTRYRLLGTGWFNEVRLRLRRGSARGRVVLVLDVQERNTLTVSRVFGGLARVVGEHGTGPDSLRPYAGLGLSESNLLGQGVGAGVTAVVSEAQFGLDLRYHDPLRLGAGFDLNGRLFYNHAREFFGRHADVAIECPEPDPDVAVDADAATDEAQQDMCDPDVRARRAVVIYNRVGVGIGTSHELTSNLRYEFDWLGELVTVTAKPFSAITARGKHDEESEPIDFHIDDGTSRVSSLHLGLIFDRRDDPALPSKGQLARFDARIGTGLIGSTYDFARVEASGRQYFPLPWHHVFSLGAFVGTVFGPAPFFYRFYAADLSDLLPSRALELNLDHRRTHNLLDTSIKEFDKEDLAARLDFEYQLPLHRGGGDVRGVDAYAGGGVFLLADREALRAGLPGYHGFSRWPLDLTFDLGVQADTAIGVFRVGFSSFIGFLPDFGRERQ